MDVTFQPLNIFPLHNLIISTQVTLLHAVLNCYTELKSLFHSNVPETQPTQYCEQC
jgi:hypothetical protein